MQPTSPLDPSSDQTQTQNNLSIPHKGIPMAARRPGFGAPLQDESYYIQVSDIINVLREFSSLSTIARHLTAQGFRTPAGKDFTKLHVANFLRSTQYKPA